MGNPSRTRTRVRALARHGDAASVTVRIDPKRVARFRELMHTLESAERDEARDFDRYWEAVGEIVDAELYLAGGFATADAFLRATVKEPKRTATRMIRVARYASPEEEQRYGVAVLDAALSYVEAKTGGPARGRLPVRFETLRFEIVRDGKTHSLALGDATLAEIRAATRALAARAHKTPARSSPAETALARALAATPALAGISVHVSDGKARFGEVPLYALAEFTRALRETRLPDGAGENAPGAREPAANARRAAPKPRKPAGKR